MKAEAPLTATAGGPPQLTTAEQEVLKETWKLLEPRLPDHGIALYVRLFQIAPSTRGLFAFGLDEDAPMETDPTMRLHATEVMKSLGLAACRVGQSMRIGSVLEKLGRKHVDYGASLEAYSMLKEAFMYVIENALGNNSCEEILTSWSKAYDCLVHEMKRGHRNLLAERQQSESASKAAWSPIGRLKKQRSSDSKTAVDGARKVSNWQVDSHKGSSWHGATNFAPPEDRL